MSVISLAAAGNSLATATAIPITEGYVLATVGAADQGLTLPIMKAGQRITVKNTHNANNLKVYPPVATALMDGGAGAAHDVAALTSAVFVSAGPSYVQTVVSGVITAKGAFNGSYYGF